MIERTIQGAANLSNEELQSISQQSRNILAQLGTEIQWV
jgi:trimethylamine:corrinoid methyltransferase-like protein